jgi:hypothetical protein
MKSLTDAKKYLAESIKEWEASDEQNKIISLAAFAEKWRSTEGGHISKMKDIQKNIRSLDYILQRNKKRHFTDNDGLEKELSNMKLKYAELEAKHGALKTKPKNLL